mmetsp:Transcript_69280/g.225695  ORF Transcript_69280/g.225695 Transcript_69280/m.225695 type:complete len:255 (+) Transcript_69280:81-845(+)
MAGLSGRRSYRNGACVMACLVVVAMQLASQDAGPESFVLATAGARAPSAAATSAAAGRQPRVARQFFQGFPFGEEKPQFEDVVIKEDYTLAGIFLALGTALIASLPFAGLGIGPLILLLGILFFVQAGRVRFVFDKDAFSLQTKGDEEDALNKPGQNIVVGGDNRWAYSSFVNYEFFPKGFLEKGLPPILVYFKETQTPEDKWGAGPSKASNSEEALKNGAVPGMVHFFPAICDCKQIEAEFERRGCKKISSVE